MDGCGVPVFGISVRGFARAFARLPTATPGTPENKVAEAVRAAALPGE